MKEFRIAIIGIRMRFPALICLLLFCLSSVPAFSQTAVTVLNNGDPQNRVDIAVLGDGYTSGEMGKFADDVLRVIDGIFVEMPLGEYQRYFNVHRIDVASRESGADHPELNIYKDTAFDASYNTNGIQRMLTASNSKVLAAAMNGLPLAKRDIYLLIVNDSQYGGSGGQIAVVSTNSAVVDLVLHEEGHALALLADEYGGPPPPECNASYEPDAVNVTKATERSSIKWSHWIDPLTPIPTYYTSSGIPGLFQGAQYCDFEKYRPTYASKMRVLYGPFDQVNSEQLVKRIYNWVSPVDDGLPAQTDISVTRGRAQIFSVSVPRPMTHDLDVNWFLDGRLAGSGLEFTVDTSSLTTGPHAVEVIVEDHSDFVRKDSGHVLREVRDWTLRVTDPAGINLALSPGGAAAASTSGTDGTVQTGYAALDVNSGADPYGIAVFSLKQDGVTVTEAGVPPSPPTNSARIFIDYRSDINALPGRGNAGLIDTNTGIVVVNRGSAPANVTYTLRDLEGKSLAAGRGSVSAGRHVACFINQLKETGAAPDFDLPPDFQRTIQFATLEISSDQPVSVLGLRGTTNQENKFLITTLPVADLTQPLSGDAVYFPQFADGGGYTTSLILINTSDAVERGTLQILDDYGNPIVVTRAGGARGSEFRYSINPAGVFHFQTDGSPADVYTGWVRLIPDALMSAPAGSGLFSYNPDAVLVTESGIPSAVPTTHARIYVDLSNNHNTGLAIANVTGSQASISMSAFEKDGTTGIGSSRGPLRLAPYGHNAAFADQYMTGLPAGFTGLVDIRSSTPFAALTLRSLVNGKGDFLMTTFPIADANKTAPAPILFPHIADGGGYATQFLLISRAEASTTTLHFYNESGTAINLIE